MLYWTLKHNRDTRRGWCHPDSDIQSALQSVVYRTGISIEEMKNNGSTIQFLYRDCMNLGTYFCDKDEFRTTEFYDKHPNISNIWA